MKGRGTSGRRAESNSLPPSRVHSFRLHPPAPERDRGRQTGGGDHHAGSGRAIVITGHTGPTVLDSGEAAAPAAGRRGFGPPRRIAPAGSLPRFPIRPGPRRIVRPRRPGGRDPPNRLTRRFPCAGPMGTMRPRAPTAVQMCRPFGPCTTGARTSPAVPVGPFRAADATSRLFRRQAIPAAGRRRGRGPRPGGTYRWRSPGRLRSQGAGFTPTPPTPPADDSRRRLRNVPAEA